MIKQKKPTYKLSKESKDRDRNESYDKTKQPTYKSILVLILIRIKESKFHSWVQLNFRISKIEIDMKVYGQTKQPTYQ